MSGGLEGGVTVIERNDSNFDEVAENISDTLLHFLRYTPEETVQARKQAAAIAKKAEWKSFFQYYRKAYEIALNKRDQRLYKIQNPTLL